METVTLPRVVDASEGGTLKSVGSSDGVYASPVREPRWRRARGDARFVSRDERRRAIVARVQAALRSSDMAGQYGTAPRSNASGDNVYEKTTHDVMGSQYAGATAAGAGASLARSAGDGARRRQ